MKKVMISTVYKGYNYGSSLQAFATKLFVSKLGFDAELVGYGGVINKGRDIRLKKIMIIFIRTIWRPNLLIRTFSTFKSSISKKIDADSRRAFIEFTSTKLLVKELTWSQLKGYAANEKVLACICGSDQIWNATSIYVDPFYYLKYAPFKKRVAFAPSFGKNTIPNYNEKVIKQNISKIKYLSVREEQGAKIIESLIGRKVPVLIDPTLLVEKDEWIEVASNEKYNEIGEYILLYFLDKPSATALRYIEKLIDTNNFEVITIPTKHIEFNKFPNCRCVSAGPIEFVSLVQKATFVCTDSFHGMAFSINFNIPFLVFSRYYGAASDQSSRIISLLDKLELSNRFVKGIDNINKEDFDIDNVLSFENSNKLLQIEREKSREYLLDVFLDIY